MFPSNSLPVACSLFNFSLVLSCFRNAEYLWDEWLTCFLLLSYFLSSAVRQFLLFSSQLAVRGIPFNLSSQEDIILPITGSPSYFVGVDFSAEDDAIFFSDTAKDIIYKQKVDGTGEYFLGFSSSVVEEYPSTVMS